MGGAAGEAGAAVQRYAPGKFDDPARFIKMPVEGLLVAQGVEVLCGELAGTLLPGGRRGEEKVRMHSTGLSVSAPDFERAAGRGSTKKWRRSLRVVDMHRAHLNGLCVQDWLVQKGMVSGYRAVNRPVAIYWPDEDVLYKGVLTEYKVASGEHKNLSDTFETGWISCMSPHTLSGLQVMYADGETETLHLCLQSFMWLDDQPGDGSGELIHNAPTGSRESILAMATAARAAAAAKAAAAAGTSAALVRPGHADGPLTIRVEFGTRAWRPRQLKRRATCPTLIRGSGNSRLTVAAWRAESSTDHAKLLKKRRVRVVP